MTKEEAIFKCQHELWDKGPFFQTEMAQYAERLAFEKGVEFAIEKVYAWLSDYFKYYDFYTEFDIKEFHKAMEE